ncbi:MAG: phosphate ABC transporter substrate-binding protein PstS, partial [Proteobacteria bacterium]|nr:phosphate ABC transporter substrate-binding protein PstS [Pseudomonadota bacterium]
MKVFCKTVLAVIMITIGIFGIANATTMQLTGAGATFPYPLYAKMFSVYHNNYGIQVNYQAIGSGG